MKSNLRANTDFDADFKKGPAKILRYPYNENTASPSSIDYIGNDDPGSLPLEKSSSKTRLSDENFIAAKADVKSVLYDTFDRILIAYDTNLSRSERSNSFDEWKDLLKVISRKADHFTGNHRKILGCLITATMDKDIFDIEQYLPIFIEASNFLRLPRVSKPEAKQIISKITRAKLPVLIALDPDNIDASTAKELDLMISELLKKAKIHE